jgi:hypothetical protein
MPEKNIVFHIAGISELEYSYKNHLSISEFSGNTAPENISVGLNINYRWNLEKELFGVQVDLMFALEKGEEDRFEFLKHTSLTEYFVKNLADIFSVKNETQFNIEKPWEITFVSLAISTARGMLAARTAGTFYSKFTFPVIDPSKVILSERLNSQKE